MRFINANGPHSNLNSSLQLYLTEDRSIATIRATWINTTIIIRKIAGYLAVTLHIPLEIAIHSEGLCTGGCPPQQYVGMSVI